MPRAVRDGREAVVTALDVAEVMQAEARLVPGGDRELDSAVQAYRHAAYRLGRRWALVVAHAARPEDVDRRLATPQRLPHGGDTTP
jgi:hypothetical protein